MERVTVDFDTESYYLDGEYWESWDNYGEEMADAINKELNKQDQKIKQLELNCLIAQNCMQFFAELIQNVMLEKLKKQEALLDLYSVVDEMATLLEELENYKENQEEE